MMALLFVRCLFIEQKLFFVVRPRFFLLSVGSGVFFKEGCQDFVSFAVSSIINDVSSGLCFIQSR